MAEVAIAEQWVGGKCVVVGHVCVVGHAEVLS